MSDLYSTYTTLDIVSTELSLTVSDGFASNTTSAVLNDAERIATARQSYVIVNGLISPTICLIGIIGNFVNIVIFIGMLRISKSAIHSCLLVIAIADIFIVLIYFLYGVFCILSPPKPILSPVDIEFYQAGTFTYLLFYIWTIPTNAFFTISNWCTVTVMILRFIAVYFPLKASLWCSPSRTRNVLCLISFLSIVNAIPECFVLKLHRSENIGFIVSFTDLLDNKMFYYIYYITYLEVTNCILPFIICLVLSALLIRTLSRRSKVLGAGSQASHHQKKRQQDQRKVSVMLLVVVALFIICTIPGLVWRSLKYMVYAETMHQSTWITLRSVSDLFLIINHTGNFILYLFTNDRYRKRFREIFLCRPSSQPSNMTVNMSMVTHLSQQNSSQKRSANHDHSDTQLRSPLIMTPICQISNEQELLECNEDTNTRNGHTITRSSGTIADGVLERNDDITVSRCEREPYNMNTRCLPNKAIKTDSYNSSGGSSDEILESIYSCQSTTGKSNHDLCTFVLKGECNL